MIPHIFETLRALHGHPIRRLFHTPPISFGIVIRIDYGARLEDDESVIDDPFGQLPVPHWALVHVDLDEPLIRAD